MFSVEVCILNLKILLNVTFVYLSPSTQLETVKLKEEALTGKPKRAEAGLGEIFPGDDTIDVARLIRECSSLTIEHL